MTWVGCRLLTSCAAGLLDVRFALFLVLLCISFLLFGRLGLPVVDCWCWFEVFMMVQLIVLISVFLFSFVIICG